jgi:hypothetical protein
VVIIHGPLPSWIVIVIAEVADATKYLDIPAGIEADEPSGGRLESSMLEVLGCMSRRHARV